MDIQNVWFLSSTFITTSVVIIHCKNIFNSIHTETTKSQIITSQFDYMAVWNFGQGENNLSKRAVQQMVQDLSAESVSVGYFNDLSDLMIKTEVKIELPFEQEDSL